MEFKPYSLKPLFQPSSHNNSDVAIQNSGSLSAINAVFRLNFEAVAACDNHIFVGTSDGTLIHLTMDFQSQSNTEMPHTQLVQIFSLDTKRKVQKLSCHKKLKLLLVLCDSVLSIFNFDLELQDQYEPQRGVIHFDLDFFSNQLDIGILCLAKRRSLQIFLLTNELVLRKDIPLNEPITSLCYSGSNVIVSDSYYRLIDLKRAISVKLAPVQVKTSHSRIDIGSPFNKRPIVIFIDDEEFMVVSGEENGALGMFFNSAGDPSRGTLSWPIYPRWVGFDFPFTIAILPNNQIMVHNIVTQQVFQKMSLPDRLDLKGLVDHCDLQHFVPSLDQKLNRGLQEDCHAATILTTNVAWGKNFILAFLLKPILLEVDPLLDAYQLERSVLIAEQYSTVISSQSIHHYRMQRELEHIYQKCGLLYMQQTLLDDAIPLLIQGNIDPRVVINLFPDLALPEFTEDLLLDPGVASVANRLTNFQDIIKGSINQNYLSETGDNVEDRLLVKNFYQMLESYLNRLRKRHYDKDTTLTKPQLLALDTTLLKLLSFDSNTDKLYNWLTIEKHKPVYLPDHCIEFLSQREKHYAVSLIYLQVGKSDEVISIWKDLFEQKIAPFNNGIEDLKKIMDYCITIQHVELVWETSQWIIEKQPEWGVDNLRRLPQETLDQIGIDKILNYLTQQSELIRGKQSFLEYLISDQLIMDQNLHIELFDVYLNQLKSLYHNEIELTKELKAQERAFVIHHTIHPKSTFLSFLSDRPDTLSQLRSSLIQFINFTNLLDHEQYLNQIQKISNLTSELIIVHSKMKNYEKSIQLLVQINDFSEAEYFCINRGFFDFQILIKPKFPLNPIPNHIDDIPSSPIKAVESSLVDSNSSEMIQQRLFAILFNTLLNFNDEHTVLIQVSSLLSRHYTRFNLLDVLSKLPVHWSLDLFAPFFIKSLKKLNENSHHLEIVKSLTMADNIKTNYDLIETIQSVDKSGDGPIVINESTRCGKCQKFIGDSVISISPVDSSSSSRYIPIYHLHCVQNQK